MSAETADCRLVSNARGSALLCMTGTPSNPYQSNGGAFDRGSSLPVPTDSPMQALEDRRTGQARTSSAWPPMTTERPGAMSQPSNHPPKPPAMRPSSTTARSRAMAPEGRSHRRRAFDRSRQRTAAKGTARRETNLGASHDPYAHDSVGAAQRSLLQPQTACVCSTCGAPHPRNGHAAQAEVDAPGWSNVTTSCRFANGSGVSSIDQTARISKHCGGRNIQATNVVMSLRIVVMLWTSPT